MRLEAVERYSSRYLTARCFEDFAWFAVFVKFAMVSYLLELMLFVLVFAAVQFEGGEARMGKLELVRLLELLEEDSLS